jgi:hypothetical protein
MKKHLIVLFVLLLTGICAIHAQQLNYQGIARNANGVAMTYQNISLRLSIKDGTTTSSATEYTETRQVRTNQFGLFTVVIGSAGATDVVGNMLTVNWVAGNKYLQVEIDPDGGSNFLFAGISQLQAVPYAIFATAAYPVGAAGGDLRGSNYPNPIVAPRAITNSKLSDTSVSTAKIIDGSVTNVKIASPFISINNLQVKLGNGQYFKTDTIGTEFNISSVDSTHQFNIPIASSTKRGLLKQTDWINFNNKLSSADTAFMLSNYFRKADTSVILSNRLKISDSAAMLSGYLRKIDTAKMLLPFVRYTDTAAQMNGYLRKNLAVLYSDTAAQMSGYLRKNLALLISDTAAAFSVRPLTSRFLDTAAALHARIMSKLNITDAALTYVPLTRTLNGQALSANQIFVTGAGGTDFSINSAAGIHTFNIPTASGTARGLLNSSDWTVFNNKQSAITLGSTAQYFKGDLSLGTFLTDVRSQFSAGSGVTITGGTIALANTAITLNGLSLALGGSQTFVPGTSGTDFGISSSAGVHTFNLPTATATNRGLLQSSDWTIFNNKQNTISLTGENYLSYNAGTSAFTAGQVDLSGTNVKGTLADARFGALSGDVTNTAGTYATTVGKIQGVPISTSAPTDKQILKYNSSTTKWEAALDESANQWKITGNGGLSAATNFLGTTDAVPLRFKVQSTWAGELSPNSSSTSFGVIAGENISTAAGNNTAIGSGAMNKTTIGTDNTAVGQASFQNNLIGGNNTAIGQNALNLSTGNNNTAVGKSALRLNVVAGNTAVGAFSLEFTTNGAENTAVGYNSLFSNIGGASNTAIGKNALFKNITGSNNTAIGYNADISTDGLTNATAIGSGSTVYSDNTVQLGNTSVELVNTSGAVTAGGRITGTGARFKYRELTVDYTVTINDYYLKILSNAIIITLPNATLMDGQRFVFYNASSGLYNHINLHRVASQIIEGIGSGGVISINGTLVLFSDGANWLIESRNN